MKSVRYLIVFFFAMMLMTFAVTQAQAASEKGSAIVIMPSFFYFQNDIAQGTTTTKANYTYMTIAGGYKFDMGLYVGGQYVMNSTNATTEVSGASTETKQAFSAFGPSVGYMNMGFYGVFTYLLSPSSKYTSSGSDTTYSGGTSMKFDIGYSHMFTPNVGLGPQLTYWAHSYKKSKNASGTETDLPDEQKHTEIYPQIALTIMF
jgi:hypothetical protein